MHDDPADEVRAAACPICGQPRDARFKPFCSRGCRDQDLLHWLDGAYAVPAVEVEVEDQDQQGKIES